jgi:hypothetical protein
MRFSLHARPRQNQSVEHMTYKTIKEIVLEVEKGQDLCDFKELEQIETYNITDFYDPGKLPTKKFYQQVIKNEWVIKNNKQFD